MSTSTAPQRVYLDYASAWPLRPEAARAQREAAEMAWADPARRHSEARAARDLLDRSTATVTEVLGAPDTGIVWTSSGTESIHLAVLGSVRAAIVRGDPRRHLVVSAVEHSSVLATVERACEELGATSTVVGVDRSGVVDAEEMIAAIRPDTLAVHLQHANHEVGAIQPTHEVGAACRERGVLLHVDACQTVGQLGVTLEQVGADLLSASSAKLGGPRGLGLLAVGPRGRVAALLVGDERQRRRRSGMEDVAGIAGFAVALRVAADRLDTERSHRELLRRHLRERLPDAVPDVEVHGPLADAHPGIVAASALYMEGEALVAALDERGFAVHSGSSCATTSGLPSHVLVAMEALTHGHVRVSVGPSTSIKDADAFLDAFGDVVEGLRRTAGMQRGGAAQGRRDAAGGQRPIRGPEVGR